MEAPVASGIGSWVPHGRGLPAEDWSARHRFLSWILAADLTAIVIYATLQGFGLWHGISAASPSVLLLIAATLPGSRRFRAEAVSLGLLAAAAVFVYLSHGRAEAHLHYFVVIALIALYEDWAVYLLAVVFVFAANVLVGQAARNTVYASQDGSIWILAAIEAGFATAIATSQMIFWHHNEQSRRRVEHYREQLYEGQQSLMARLEETDRIRSDLVATVSHEFRTPLTGIRGALLTIKRRRDRMSPAQFDDLLDSAVNYSDRLSRLLENMLTAATATGTDETTIADLPEVVNEVLTTLAYSPSTAANVSVDLPDALPVRMARQALHQVVANLVDNALTHSWPGAPVRLIAGRVGDEVVLRVRNPGPDLDPGTIRQLFEPFTQRDGSATRETDGAGMGLYVVRRLVEVHGGRLRMASENGEIIVEVDMWAATPRPNGQAATTGPIRRTTSRPEAAPFNRPRGVGYERPRGLPFDPPSSLTAAGTPGIAGYDRVEAPAETEQPAATGRESRWRQPAPPTAPNPAWQSWQQRRSLPVERP
jgi:signal transduction histidine kinase